MAKSKKQIKGRKIWLIILLVAFAVLAVKFVYFNVTPSGLVGSSQYKNLLGQQAICSVSPASVSGDKSCSNISFCVAGICIITKSTAFKPVYIR